MSQSTNRTTEKSSNRTRPSINVAVGVFPNNQTFPKSEVSATLVITGTVEPEERPEFQKFTGSIFSDLSLERQRACKDAMSSGKGSEAAGDFKTGIQSWIDTHKKPWTVSELTNDEWEKGWPYYTTGISRLMSQHKRSVNRSKL